MSFSLIKRIPRRELKGEVSLPGDKSITHRALILSAISNGRTTISNFPFNQDCLSTVKILKELGIKINLSREGSYVVVYGRGLCGLKQPSKELSAGESGTTLRLMLGLLAGQSFKVKLTAGISLSHRPMLRVTGPLRMMGAVIKAKGKRQKAKGEEYPPITIQGGNLKGINYRMPVASAQVKSAILLAGLYAQGKTIVIDKFNTRDHTERMLKLFKARIKVQGDKIIVQGNDNLVSPRTIIIPADISSAAFFIVLAAITPGSEVVIKNVSLNPYRTGVIKVLKRMGAKIKVKSQNAKVKSYEPVGDLIIESSRLKGIVVTRQEIPSLIDELPILMVAAGVARGKTTFRGVGELRVKEADRIRSMSENLSKMGTKVKIIRSNNAEDIIIEGVKKLKGAKVKSFGDHRTAMSMVVAGLSAQGQTSIDDVSCINKSFPDFLKVLKTLIGK